MHSLMPRTNYRPWLLEACLQEQSFGCAQGGMDSRQLLPALTARLAASASIDVHGAS